MNYKIIKYENKYRAKVLKLFNHLYLLNSEEIENLFSWKYEKNPYTCEPLAFIALKDEKVISFRGFFMQKFRIKDQYFKIANLADTITDPDFRRQGLFYQTTKYAIDVISKEPDIKLLLNLSASWPPTGGYLKLGWQEIATRDRLYFMTVRGLINELFKKKHKNFKEHIKNSEDIFHNKQGSENINITSKVYANEISTLVHELTDFSKITNVRDEEYYNWRYSNLIFNYIFVYQWNGNKLISFLVYKERLDQRFTLIDYCFDNYQSFGNMLSFSLKKLKPTIIDTWIISREREFVNILKKHGFISMKMLYKFSKKLIHPPALVRPTNKNLNEKDWIIDSLNIKEVGSWNLFHIDSDGI